MTNTSDGRRLLSLPIDTSNIRVFLSNCQCCIFSPQRAQENKCGGKIKLFGCDSCSGSILPIKLIQVARNFS